jgi:hypothetical protein
VDEISTGLRRKLPLGEMPLALFVGINVVVYGFCFTTLILSARDGRLATFLPGSSPPRCSSMVWATWG